METTMKLVEGLDLNINFETRSYSGRGMYGTECVGITTSESAWSLLSALVEYHKWLDEDDESMADERELIEYMIEHEPHTDSMGFNTIYYWPRLTLASE